MDEKINIKADFITFKNQIVEKFGEQYFDQTELFFERSMAQAENGFILSAIADGKFALELSNYSYDKSGIQFLIGFLSQLHCDLGQIGKAKGYYELGIKLLDPEDKDFEDDKQLFLNLKEHIDSEGWQGRSEENTNEE